MWNKEYMTRGLGKEGEPYLLFSLGGEIYGIHIERLREIVSPAGMKPLSPPAFKYCLELSFRGSRIPVIHVSKFFDYPGGPEEPKSVLVIGDQDRQFGLLVDEIRGVWNIRDTELKPFPRFASSLNPQYIRGIGKVEKRPVFLLNETSLSRMGEISSFYGQ